MPRSFLSTGRGIIKLASSAPPLNYYEIISLPKDASLAQIKNAYHRALLQSHPDKRKSDNPKAANEPDISLIKEAYRVLSHEELRTEYDAQLAETASIAGPRPAQVISLEDFEEDRDSAIAAEDAEDGPWRSQCRCGGWYRISVALMERGEHLIGCSSCSEAIWVGYELVDVET